MGLRGAPGPARRARRGGFYINPSRGGPEIPEKPLFGQKWQKGAKMPKNGKKGHFYGFRGFLGPSGAPRGSRKRGFYINPSRRGPAVPRGPGVGSRAAQARGRPPEGVQGVSPWGVGLRSRAAPGSEAAAPTAC